MKYSKENSYTAARLLCMALFCTILLCGCTGIRKQAPQPESTVQGGGLKFSAEPYSRTEDFGVFTCSEITEQWKGSTVRRRIYSFDDGTVVEWLRIYDTEGPVTLFETGVSQGRVLITQRSWWNCFDLKPAYISDGWVFAETPEVGYIFLTPRCYRLLQNGGLQELPEKKGVLHIDGSSGSYAISLATPQIGAGCCCDCMIMKSPQKIAAFGDTPGPGGSWDFWCPFDNTGVWRWAFDGYYFLSENTYVPTGENVYTNMPACYLAASLLKDGGTEPAAEKLALCLCHSQIQQQNEEGYIPSLYFSKWLHEEYGIGTGFYDTRFNSDFAIDCAALYERSGAGFLKDYLRRYADFYVGMAEKTGRSSGQGLWVPDYYTAAEHKTPHTALNHQLAEIMALYRMESVLDDASLGILADRMLLAIEETAPQWICKDGSLEYAILPSGRFGFTDYDYLTYNDLFDMQAVLLQRRGKESEALAQLMASKKKQMDAYGITEYKK